MGAMFFGKSKFSSPWAETSTKGFFSVRMIEKIALQGRCCYQAKIKVSVVSTGKPSKHRKIKRRKIYSI